MLPDQLEEKILNNLTSKIQEEINIIRFEPVSGGCINNTYKIITDHDIFFLKWNRNSPEGMFEKEVKGLKLIQKSNTICTPECISYSNQFLILEFIEESMPGNCFWENFGRNLAELHKISNETFGLEYDNFIGLLNQNNMIQERWIDFFINQRINKQLEIGDFSSSFLQSFDKLILKIEDFFPHEPSSLLHGDFWSGNFLTRNNQAIVVDPAVYFGSREMDISMSKLFGGFTQNFYSAYEEVYPLSAGWKERVDICNLYPLLVHVNLFGGSYYSKVCNIINRFI